MNRGGGHCSAFPSFFVLKNYEFHYEFSDFGTKYKHTFAHIEPHKNWLYAGKTSIMSHIDTYNIRPSQGGGRRFESGRSYQSFRRSDRIFGLACFHFQITKLRKNYEFSAKHYELPVHFLHGFTFILHVDMCIDVHSG